MAILRAPIFGSVTPPHAAVTPRKKMARENTQATWLFDQPYRSWYCRTRRSWKKLHAYTVPRQSMRTVPMIAMSHRPE